MKRGISFTILAILTLILVSACAIGSKGGRVLSYRDGTVYLTDKNMYSVGKLDDGWKKIKPQARVVSFYNSAYGATISTEGFCGHAFEDSALDVLTNQLLGRSKDSKIVLKESFKLADRGALRTKASGTVDGVNVSYTIVVTKKDGCNFDFILVSPYGQGDDANVAFDKFIEGFSFK